MIRLIEKPVVDVDYNPNIKHRGKIDIIDARLLSVEEAEKLPLRLRLYYDGWWLSTPTISNKGTVNEHNLVTYVESNGKINTYGWHPYDKMCVRPALILNNPQKFGIGNGSIIEFGGKEFEVISPSLAFCTDCIGKHRFSAETNDYEKSDIKRYIHWWLHSNI